MRLMKIVRKAGLDNSNYRRNVTLIDNVLTLLTIVPRDRICITRCSRALSQVIHRSAAHPRA